METIIAFCGLACHTCPIHLATLEQDKSLQQAMRESIAEQCSAIYGMVIQAGDVTDCDGCSAGAERLFPGCKKCEIRNCAMQRNLESCAYCGNYACETLERHFSLDPIAKDRLEEIRSGFGKN